MCNPTGTQTALAPTEDKKMAIFRDTIELDVMMQAAEIDAIVSFLYPDKTSIMFEYGSGGSTHYFAQLCAKLYS